MNKDIVSINVAALKTKIYFIRNQYVMLDSDLAAIYGVQTKAFNQAVKRNKKRFPEELCFQLTKQELENLRSQIVTSSKREMSHGGRRYNPYVFTEQGIAMLSAVLNSDLAIKISIKIINAFVEMRRFLLQNAHVFARLDSVEKKQLAFEAKTEKNFERVFEALESVQEKPKQGVFYDGQVYDAYAFVCRLIRSAKKSLVLVDNYVDESVLTLLGKRSSDVKATIYTKSISKQFELDLNKYNEQYPNILVKVFSSSHDRFLIIDEKTIYHIGASLKDLGKKWFAFSKLEPAAMEMLRKLKAV